MRVFAGLLGEPQSPCIYFQLLPQKTLRRVAAYHLNPRPAVAATPVDAGSLPVLVGRVGDPRTGLPSSLAGVVALDKVLGVVYEMSDGTLPQSLLD